MEEIDLILPIQDQIGYEIKFSGLYNASMDSMLSNTYEVWPSVTVKDSIMNTSLSKCNHSINYWCGKFGVQQVFEVAYLGILTVLGLIGNLMVIFSIILERKIHKSGNIFIINLAIADILITGIYTPTVIANVFVGDNALPDLPCRIFGYIIMVTCTCSMWSLAFIAFNRFIAITKNRWYKRIFSKRKGYFLVLLTWAWSVLLASPALYGWTYLIYDIKAMVCAWDDTLSISFTLFLIILAVLVPLAATIFFYWTLFMHVRHSSRKSIKVLAPVPMRGNSVLRKQSLQREVSLLKTLATAVAVFVLCWTPYSLCLIINPKGVHPLIKKICTWLGLNNSAVNFIIYGVMNKGYREGYKKLIAYIFRRSTQSDKISTSQISNISNLSRSAKTQRESRYVTKSSSTSPTLSFKRNESALSLPEVISEYKPSPAFQRTEAQSRSLKFNLGRSSYHDIFIMDKV